LRPAPAARALTLGDGVLDLGAPDDDVVVVEALLLLDERLAEHVLVPGAAARGRREFDARDEHPLRDGEGDADDRGERDEHLGGGVRQDRHCRTKRRGRSKRA